MNVLIQWFLHVRRALARTLIPTVTMGATYFLSVTVGIVMVNAHSRFALDYRDKLISRAEAGSQTLKLLQSGSHVEAALLDFGGNLVLGAVPSTVAGMGVVTAYPMAAFRGWVGGVVSVDDSHHSRLAHARSAAYYLLVLFLQLLPYSLAGGAGVSLGLSVYQTWKRPGIERLWFLPREATTDALWVYSIVVPLFLVASLVEFLAA